MTTKFKVGDVVRVKATAPPDLWWISYGPAYRSSNGSPETTARAGDLGVVTTFGDYANVVVQWFRTGAVTDAWTDEVIEHVEVCDG